MSTDSKLDSVLSTYRSLTAQRAPWESWWEQLREFVLPRRVDSFHMDSSASSGDESRTHLYDTTAIEACQRLAGGHMSYITPSHEVWFKWSSPETKGDDEAERWYNTCSEIALAELSISNFYTEIHECFLDRVALGTGSLYVGTSSEGRLLFKNIPCGQFSCAEDAEGRVDTYFREFMLSPHQAADMFGIESLGEHAREMLTKGKSTHVVSLRFLHAVFPRRKRDKRKAEASHMPFESIYISLDDRKIVEQGGYQEFPYLVSRFLKWGERVYGIAPGRMVMPDIKQAQFLNRILDTLGEVAAFPRILELANQIGEIDLRAGGRTIITPEAASLHLPREWATQGRYDVGIDRLHQKQDSIRRAFFLPMLELWGNRDTRMTATEVMARENERVLTFFPSFSLFISDLYGAMCRIFALLFRAGRFPQPPRAVLKQGGKGELLVSEPRVVYQSKIALVLRRVQADGVERTLARLQSLLPIRPDLADHIDMDQCFRLMSRFDGVPEHIIRSSADVSAMRTERSQDAQPQADPSQEELPQETWDTLLAKLAPNSQELPPQI